MRLAARCFAPVLAAFLLYSATCSAACVPAALPVASAPEPAKGETHHNCSRPPEDNSNRGSNPCCAAHDHSVAAMQARSALKLETCPGMMPDVTVPERVAPQYSSRLDRSDGPCEILRLPVKGLPSITPLRV